MFYEICVYFVITTYQVVQVNTSSFMVTYQQLLLLKNLFYT